MRNLFMKNLFIVCIAGVIIFTSCSRQVASTKSVSKMLYNETLTEARVQKPEVIRPCLPPINTIQSQSENNVSLSIEQKDKSGSSLIIKDNSKKFVQSFKVKIIHEFQKQTAIVKKIAINHNIASYSGSQHTEGMLGIAGLCLIAAIALAVFGVVNMGMVFWEIAAVLLIAAIVFFILYLVAKVAGPSTP